MISQAKVLYIYIKHVYSYLIIYKSIKKAINIILSI